MSANHYDTKLEQLEYRATGRLLVADVFDGAAFQALYDYVEGKAADLQNESVLSKQILKCLRGAAAAILSRSEYVPAVQENLAFVQRFETLLDLLIAGERPEDRRSGIPRIL
jgi:hypothetical protein